MPPYWFCVYSGQRRRWPVGASEVRHWRGGYRRRAVVGHQFCVVPHIWLNQRSCRGRVLGRCRRTRFRCSSPHAKWGPSQPRHCADGCCRGSRGTHGCSRRGSDWHTRMARDQGFAAWPARRSLVRHAVQPRRGGHSGRCRGRRHSDCRRSEFRADSDNDDRRRRRRGRLFRRQQLPCCPAVKCPRWRHRPASVRGKRPAIRPDAHWAWARSRG